MTLACGLDHTKVVWVAELGDEITGFMIVHLYPGSIVAEIRNNAVSPSHQSAAIGTAMYSFVLNYTREAVMKSLLVTTGCNEAHAPAGFIRKPGSLALYLRLNTTSNFNTESYNVKSGAMGLDQLMIDIEDNENSGYFPIQIFETQSELRTAAMITIPTLPGKDGPFDVVGWCSDDGGTLCEVTSVVVGDSGSGQALMIYGGDHGVRMRSANSTSDWSLESDEQIGEPYLLLQTSVDLIFSL